MVPPPILVTVREVLKYSLTWVIIPSETVQAWTQYIERLRSQPSANTMGPKEVMTWGSKVKTFLDDEEWRAPVRRRIKNWWEGGPWNHHSRSGVRMLWTVETSWDRRAW